MSQPNPYQPPMIGPAVFPGQMPSVELALARVKVPAMCILVLALITVLLRVIGIVWQLMEMGQAGNANPQVTTALTPAIMGNGMALLFNVATAFGAQKMLKLQSYSSAMTAAVLSVIPVCSPCVLLGIPFGVWALIVLNDPNVKASFRP